jgi:hypothetical protein
MRRPTCFLIIAAFAAPCVHTQDISGDWQGSLKVGQQELRIILKVTRADTVEWEGHYAEHRPEPRSRCWDGEGGP